MVRLKTRYLLFEILYPENAQYQGDIQEYSVDLRRSSPSDIDARKLTHILRESIELNFGEWGTGVVASTISVKYFSQTTSTGIVRVGRDHFRLVWGALSYISEINRHKVTIRVSQVSGTIKKCEQAAIKRNKIAIASKGEKALSAFEIPLSDSVEVADELE